jgi:hypothetical protein
MSRRGVSWVARRAMMSFVLAVLISPLLPGFSSASTATVLVVNASANPLLASDPLSLSFVVTPATAGIVLVTISNGTNSPPVVIDRFTGSGSWTVSGLPVGKLDVTSRFRATDTAYLDSSTIIGGLAVLDAYPDKTTVLLTASSNPSYVGHESTLTARVIGPGGAGAPVDPGGTVAFEADGTGIAFASAPLADGTATVSAAAVPVGTHIVFARYIDGNGASIGVGTPLTLVVISDVAVSATGVGVSYATFYPYKDSYRDTVGIRGTPNEPVSVSAKVYNSSGRKVRSWSLATRTSAWSISWNGRNASGARLAAGKYKVVQTLRDTLGNTKSYTSYTTISTKRLYYHTASQTKYGNQFSYAAATPYADVNTWSCDFYRCVNIYGNLYDEFAYVRYNFKLPSATVYKTLKLSVLGALHTPTVYVGPATMSFANFASGGEDGLRSTGLAYGWYSSSVKASGHVSSARGVRVFVTAYGYDYGNWDVAKVKLTYTYGVLQ